MDEQGERTAEPTELRLDEARRRGQVPRSADLCSAVLVLGAALLLGALGPRLLAAMTGLMKGLLAAPACGAAAGLDAASVWANVSPVLVQLGLLAGGMLVLAVVVNLAQVGLLSAGAAVAPDWSRISPLAGLRRLMSPRSAVRSAQSVVKLAAVAAVAAWTIMPAIADGRAWLDRPVDEAVASAGGLVCSLGLRVGAALLVLALLDYLYQRWQHRQDLRITPRQLKDDLKQMEGDAQLRRRRRAAAKQALEMSPRGVSAAALIVTHPSGLAVAVKYEAKSPAPQVAAKGYGAFGKRIIRQAIIAGVRVIEDKDLSLTMYRRCRVGQAAPAACHEKLAEMLAFVKTDG